MSYLKNSIDIYISFLNINIIIITKKKEMLNRRFYYNLTHTFKEKPSIKNNKIGKINKKIR